MPALAGTNGGLLRKLTINLAEVYQKMQPFIDIRTKRNLTDGCWDPSNPDDTTEGHLIVRLGDTITSPKGEKFTCQALIGSGTWSRVYSALGEGGER